jgi:uracil-DNA glycosylase
VACTGAGQFLPERRNLRALREAAAGCRGCRLYERATQTVFGEGLKRSRVAMVGETPGDREDRKGRVFVGPAGRVLDQAFEELGIDRREVYLTNAVKHFKFEERGQRRIHQTPTKAEVDACLPWLREELRIVRPEALVLMGAVAAKALLGQDFRLTRERGRPIDSDLAELVTVTVHPAAVLRAPDDRREAERQAFIRDLRLVAEHVR